MKSNPDRPVVASPLFRRPEMLIEELLNDGITEEQIEEMTGITSATQRRILSGVSDIRLSVYQSLYRLHKLRFFPTPSDDVLRKAHEVRAMREQITKRARGRELMPEVEAD